jgi:hypothetical protein
VSKCKQAENFTEADYDFSGDLSPDELQACGLYEYGRESRAAIKEVVSAREQSKQSQISGQTKQFKFSPRVQQLVQSHVIVFLSFTDGFPATPWRNLSNKDRGILLKMIEGLPHIFQYSLTWNNPPLIFSTHEPETMTLDMWREQCRKRLPSIPRTDPIKSGFFAVNLKYGRRVLVEEFAKQLTRFEGKAISATPPLEKELSAIKKPPGRKGSYDVLNALGVMRLRYYCDTFAEAQKRMQPLKDKKHGLRYATRHNANRACELALRHFKLIYGWLDSEKPIHFTEAWRGGPQK